MIAGALLARELFGGRNRLKPLVDEPPEIVRY